MRPRASEFAPRAQEVLDQPLDQGKRVRGMAVLPHQQTADVVARQSRFELAQLIGVKFVDLDAVFAAQLPGSVVFAQALERPVHVKMTEAMDETFGAGVADERLKR